MPGVTGTERPKAGQIELKLLRSFRHDGSFGRANGRAASNALAARSTS